MTTHTCIQDFDCFPFFQNVVRSKLIDAQQHLKKCELYRIHPEHVNSYQLYNIVMTHEDTHEFLKTVYQQCALWRKQSTLIGHTEKIKHLEYTAKKLEVTIDHIFYVVEHIQNKQNRVTSDDCDKGGSESVTRETFH